MSRITAVERVNTPLGLASSPLRRDASTSTSTSILEMNSSGVTPPPSPSPSSSPPAALSSAEAEVREEALRLKSVAEEKLQASSIKSALKYAKRAARLRPDLSGAGQLVTALKILRADPSDHYKVLRLTPFSPPAAVRKQYKSLALALHPDKSSSESPAAAAAAEDAFKRVADSFRFLSDRSLKRDFDLRLRLSLAADAERQPLARPPATFWTTCATCRLLHEFDRRYVGYRLVCPSCRKSFLAVEVSPKALAGVQFDDAENGAEPEKVAKVAVPVTGTRSSSRHRIPRLPLVIEDNYKKRKASVTAASPASKKARPKPPEKTLAQIQMELARAKAASKGKEKAKAKEKEKGGNQKGSAKDVKKEVEYKRKGKALVVALEEDQDEDMSLMAVEDSDFYDFDKDRTERSFRRGQIWAIYDDDDGMPRHYGLIDEVLSSNPFRLKMIWLDVQNGGDESVLLLENSGLHISCGQFKLGKKVDIDSVNCFSHAMDCQRAAREIYRIYPKKGSVWALYSDPTLAGKKGRYYDIVVFLTNYSEMYGLSMAYLEKVEGYKTIFRRREIGCHAVKWLQQFDANLFSHQIPARKLSETEGLGLPRDCWELDPASLPAELLTIRWCR